MKVRQIENSDRKHWEEFIKGSDNGTIFHLPGFLDYHPENRFRNHHILVENGKGIEAIITGALVEKDDGIWFRSYPGASWGGPVIKDNATLSRTESMMEAFFSYCRKHGWKGIEMTNPPEPYFRRPHNYLDFILVKNNFKYVRRELTAVIDLSRPGDDIDLAFSESARRGIRKALKNNLIFEEDNDFSKFYPVLQTNLQQRHGVKPTHSLEELVLLRNLLGDRIRQFVVKNGDQVLAGMVMFHCNPRVVLAFYISHDDRYQSLRPVNLVYREVIRWARDRGYHYLDLGTYTLDMDVNYGLCRFKESFSARGFFRNTFTGQL